MWHLRAAAARRHDDATRRGRRSTGEHDATITTALLGVARARRWLYRVVVVEVP
jgi:hypothetical protein